MFSEVAYVFRHALLRDAAYQLQLPDARARLHAFAFELIEAAAGGRPAGPAPLEAGVAVAPDAHPADAFAEELAAHARLCGGLIPGDSSDAERLYLRRAAHAADRTYRHVDAARCWLALSAVERGAGRGESVRRAGIASAQAENRTAAQAHLEKALDIFREAANEAGEGIALIELGAQLRWNGRLEDAERALDRGLELLRRTGARRAEGIGLGNLAVLYHETSRPEAADAAYRQALAIHRECGNHHSEAHILLHIGSLLRGLGRREEARPYLEEALALVRRHGLRRLEGPALSSLGVFYMNPAQPEIAEPLFREALAIDRELQDFKSAAITLGNLAGLHANIGRLAEAERGFREALALHREHGNLRSEALHLADFSLCLLHLGRRAEAEDAWRRGTEILRALRNGVELKRAIQLMSDTCGRLGVPLLDEEVPGTGASP